MVKKNPIQINLNPDAGGKSVYSTAVHVIHGILSCRGDAIKYEEKSKERE